MSKTSLELLVDLDLPYELILAIQQKVSQKITPTHKTVIHDVRSWVQADRVDTPPLSF